MKLFLSLWSERREMRVFLFICYPGLKLESKPWSSLTRVLCDTDAYNLRDFLYSIVFQQKSFNIDVQEPCYRFQNSLLKFLIFL
jgi:hypothetical protein